MGPYHTIQQDSPKIYPGSREATLRVVVMMDGGCRGVILTHGLFAQQIHRIIKKQYDKFNLKYLLVISVGHVAKQPDITRMFSWVLIMLNFTTLQRIIIYKTAAISIFKNVNINCMSSICIAPFLSLM